MLTSLILTFGYAGIFIAVFAESGFFLGFFLPGDSLLFTLGLLATVGQLNIFALVSIAVVAAILGDSFGYWTGAYFGRYILERHSGRFLKREYLEDTERFFAKYGRMSIFLARFVPIVRTFTPIFAGIGEMPYGIFLIYNIIGGTLWAAGLLLISYFLGRIPFVQTYASGIILAIVIVSILPVISSLARSYLKKRKGII